jgi:hypothetical protein
MHCHEKVADLFVSELFTSESLLMMHGHGKDSDLLFEEKATPYQYTYSFGRFPTDRPCFFKKKSLYKPVGCMVRLSAN